MTSIATITFSDKHQPTCLLRTCWDLRVGVWSVFCAVSECSVLCACCIVLSLAVLTRLAWCAYDKMYNFQNHSSAAD